MTDAWSKRSRVTARTLCTAASAVLCIAAGLISSAAVAEEEEWRTLLRQQLQSQYGCRLEAFLFERQVPLGGDTTRDGRIRCVDGREVDYTQSNILLKFELRLCSPTVC